MRTISKFYIHLTHDSLYRNSIFLMLSTGIMSFLGFFFWIINARLYSTEQVGIGTTLISLMTLLSSFSMLGLGNGLIKFLPKSERKNEMINTAFFLVSLMSILISVIYLIFVETFSPKLLFIRENIIFSLLFVLFVILTSLNVLSENVFISYRSSKFVLIKNTIFSIAKLILPFFLVVLAGYGIFTSVGIATAAGFLFSLLIFIFRYKYLPKPIININIIKSMTKFSLGTHIAGLLGELPVMILPVIIINLLETKYSAYFYMAMMIASILYIIPRATSQSLFAEGSYDEKELKVHFKKAVKIISIIIIPAIIIIYLFGNYILLAFGKNYSEEGIVLLKFFSVSGIFISIHALGNTILVIKNKIKLLILLNLISTAVVLSLSVILIKFSLFGVVSIGIGWIVGKGVAALIYLFLFKKLLYK